MGPSSGKQGAPSLARMIKFEASAANYGAQPKALVTGASGFIGTRLVAHLHAHGAEVVATDRLPPRRRLDGVTYESWDVRDPAPADLRAGLTRIYNLAAVHRTPGHPAHEYYETNVLGAANVTALAEACGIHEVVFTSSISVYGPSEHLMDEQSELKPTSAYGRSKKLAESIHRAWLSAGDGRQLIIVRPGVVFGPGEGGNFTYLARALSRGLFFYPGRRTTVKSGGYVDELLAALDFALSQADRDILFNFAYPEESTTEDIVQAFAQVCGYKANYATLPVTPLYAAAGVFEVADRLGLHNPVHRERVTKLFKSTRIEPGWLKAHGYKFQTDVCKALAAWRDETQGTFA